MTVARHAVAAELADVGEAVAALRAGGLRVTAARRLLLEALFGAPGPVSAEWLARPGDAATDPGDVASVYRNLELFEKLGIVRHVHLGHGPGLYALARAGEREYVVCERCGAVRSFESERFDPLREWVRERFAFEVRFSHFPLAGLCSDCAQAVAAGAEPISAGAPGAAAITEHDHPHEPTGEGPRRR